jgi:hypothetical protein
MKKNLSLVGFLSLILALGMGHVACGVGDDEGGLGEPCLPDGTCDPGLTCSEENICEGVGGDNRFTDVYNSSSFQQCSQCHAPNAPGFTQGTEATQDWTTRETAYTTLHDPASGMEGNFAGCNGVRFLDQQAENSLLVAVFDETVRSTIAWSNFPDCNADTISDMTLKIGGPLSSQELDLLKAWINDGTPDN